MLQVRNNKLYVFAVFYGRYLYSDHIGFLLSLYFLKQHLLNYTENKSSIFNIDFLLLIKYKARLSKNTVTMKSIDIIISISFTYWICTDEHSRFRVFTQRCRFMTFWKSSGCLFCKSASTQHAN